MKKLSMFFNMLFVTIMLFSTGHGASWFDSGVNKFLGIEQAADTSSDVAASSGEEATMDGVVESVPTEKPAAPAPKVVTTPTPKKITLPAKIKTPKVAATPKGTPVKPLLRRSSRTADIDVPPVALTPKTVRKTTPAKIIPPVKVKPHGIAPASVVPAAGAIDENAIEQHRLLLQPNGWECGYYSIFHYLATRYDYDAANLRELYETFIATIKADPDIAALYDDEDYTNGTQLRNIITALNARDRDEVLISNDDALIDNVIIVDEQEFFGTIPTTVDIVRKINTLRGRRETFWALVCTKRPAHWVCLMFPAEGGCFGIDSLRGARPSNTQQILVAIKNLCLGIVPLPDGDQFHSTYHNYRVVANQAASEEKDEIVEAIHDDALENGFTEETFASLMRYLNAKTQHDHVPEASGRGKKKQPEIILIDDSDAAKKPAKRRKRK